MTAILLFLLASFHLTKYFPAYSALIVAACAAYAALEFRVLVLSETRHHLARYALATFVVFALVIAPTLLEIFLRRATAPYEHIHDGALQTEAALQFLLAGKIPFGQNYAETVMGKWQHFVIDPAINPSLHHYLYLPLTFLSALPFYFFTQVTFGWFDIRLISLAAFAALWLILPALTARSENKLGLLIAFGLNPLFVPFFIEGRNDVVILFWLAAMLLALQKKRVALAAFFFALACATKATAWLAAPFFLAQLWQADRANNSRPISRMTLRALLILAATFAAILFPFLAWDFRAVLDDTLALGANTNYIWGYGISMLMLALGIVPDRLSAFPFSILQLTFGLPTIFLLWRYQARDYSPRALAGAAAIFAFVFFFFSRHFADSYLGYVLALALIGYFMDGESDNGADTQTRS